MPGKATFVGGSHDGTMMRHFDWLPVVEAFAYPTNHDEFVSVEKYTLRVIDKDQYYEIRFYAIDGMPDYKAIAKMVKAYGFKAN